MTRGPDKQFERTTVLEKAMELFWAQGYEATGMAQLLAHMGIGRQSLYNTFGDKKSLFLEALEYYFEQRMKLVGDMLSRPGSPMGRLRQMFEAMIEQAAATGYCGCFVGNSLAEFGHRDEQVKRIVAGFLEQMRSSFEAKLQEAIDCGELPPGSNAEELSQTLITTAQGMALLSKVKPDEGTARAVLRTSFSMMTGANLQSS